MRLRGGSPAAVMAALGVLQGCAPRSALPPAPLLAPLPTLPVEQTSPPPAAGSPESLLFPGIPGLDQHVQGGPITLTATNVDVRALITAITETMGISLVMDPEVEGRVTIRLEEVPALLALRMVLDEAGLALVAPTYRPLWEPVVFYTLPVNIHDASPELIQARFGVSRIAAEMATLGALELPDE